MRCRDFARIPSELGKSAYDRCVQTSSLKKHYMLILISGKFLNLFQNELIIIQISCIQRGFVWHKNCIMFFCWATDHLISLTVGEGYFPLNSTKLEYSVGEAGQWKVTDVQGFVPNLICCPCNGNFIFKALCDFSL